MTSTGTVSLETAKFANLGLHTDIEPFEIVRVVSATTVEIRRMATALDPSWAPEMIQSGFAVHCVNQNDQRWVYTVDESAPIVRMRRVKRTHANRMREWKSPFGHHALDLLPRKFHDYNS